MNSTEQEAVVTVLTVLRTRKHTYNELLATVRKRKDKKALIYKRDQAENAIVKLKEIYEIP